MRIFKQDGGISDKQRIPKNVCLLTGIDNYKGTLRPWIRKIY